MELKTQDIKLCFASDENVIQIVIANPNNFLRDSAQIRAARLAKIRKLANQIRQQCSDMVEVSMEYGKPSAEYVIRNGFAGS